MFLALKMFAIRDLIRLDTDVGANAVASGRYRATITNCYVGDVSKTVDDARLLQEFSKYGKVYNIIYTSYNAL